jgi:predicted AlkP superfamily phosphohydrolase/phosphomutase
VKPSAVKPKVVVIGLDCLSPRLVFERWREALPTFSALMAESAWGPLRSVDPPITVPAWACMMSGYSAGQLGVYGFRHREIGSYDRRYLAFADRITKPRIWDRLNAAGLSAGLLAIPQTYPPKKIDGFMISGFCAPSTDAVYTYPDKLREEIEEVVGDYVLDVHDFRSHDHARIAADIAAMTAQRFTLFRHFLATRPCDFMMLVEIGPDRMHHAFWRFSDPAHRLYEAGHPLEHAIRDYYRYLDDELARTLAAIPQEAHVFIVSDHGARAMHGGYCINDWLIRRGLLRLKETPQGATKFDEALVDWSQTKAWAWGGYYARIFLNLEGREPNGQIAAADREAFVATLKAEIEALPGPDGKPLGNRVLLPHTLVPSGEPAGDYPDLMVYFGDLDWRAVGTVGNPDVFTYSNDTGPDDANHDYDGVFIHRPPGGHPQPGRREGLRLIDVGPTLAWLFDLAPDLEATGRAMTHA